jgi:hypothetical protein
MRIDPGPVEQVALTVGETVHLGNQHEWTIAAVSEHFAAATRLITDREREDDRQEAEERAEEPGGSPAEFMKISDDKQAWYTVIDWRNGVRGPCNLVGQSWGDGSYSEAECAQMLGEFESGELEVSHRNRTWLTVERV